MGISLYDAGHGLVETDAMVCPERNFVAQHVMPRPDRPDFFVEIDRIETDFGAAEAESDANIGRQLPRGELTLRRISQRRNIFSGMFFDDGFGDIGDDVPDQLGIIGTGMFFPEFPAAFTVAASVIHSVVVVGIDHKFIRTEKRIRPAVPCVIPGIFESRLAGSFS